MTLEEFNRLSGVKLTNMDTYFKMHQIYLDSKSNKYDFVGHLMIEFKNWIYNNLEHLTTNDKSELLNHFIVYEIDYYPNL